MFAEQDDGETAKLYILPRSERCTWVPVWVGFRIESQNHPVIYAGTVEHHSLSQYTTDNKHHLYF